MARLPRLVCPGLPHLVVHHGRAGAPTFADDADAAAYLDAMLLAAREAGVRVHGYSIARAEVRLLCTPDSESGLARMMQAVGRRYVHHFNARHSQQGSPWRGRFRSAALEEGTHFLLGLLVAEGAERAGRHGPVEGEVRIRSSLGHHLGERTDALISEHPVFWGLGNTPFEREAAYRRLLEAPVSVALSTAMLAAVDKGWAFGSGAFLDRVGALTGRRPQPLKRGRPRRPGVDKPG